MNIFWTTNLDGRQSIANFRKRRTLKKKKLDAKIIEYIPKEFIVKFTCDEKRGKRLSV